MMSDIESWGHVHLNREITLKKYVELAKTIKQAYDKTSIVLSIT